MFSERKFHELIEMIEAHNELVRKCNDQNVHFTNMITRQIFHEKLRDLLKELLTFKNEGDQYEFLSKIYQWAL